MDKSPEELDALYPDGFKKLTDKTVTDKNTLYGQLKSFNLRGYSEEIEESTEYIRCFGVAIRKDGKTLGAISVAIPTFRYKEEDKNLYVEGLKRSAERLSKLLG